MPLQDITMSQTLPLTNGEWYHVDDKIIDNIYLPIDSQGLTYNRIWVYGL